LTKVSTPYGTCQVAAERTGSPLEAVQPQSYGGRTAGTNANSATLFKCPVDKKGRFAAEGSSYEWNADLNGQRVDSVVQTAKDRLLAPESPYPLLQMALKELAELRSWS